MYVVMLHSVTVNEFNPGVILTRTMTSAQFFEMSVNVIVSFEESLLRIDNKYAESPTFVQFKSILSVNSES